MYTLLVILILVAAVLMIGIVLIQESKGGGLSSGFSSGNQIMGVRKTTDFIEKATWGLAAFMVVISVFCAWNAPTTAANASVIENMATPQQQQTAPTNLPGFGASEKKDEAAAKENTASKTEEAPAAAKQQEAPKAE